MCSSNQWEIAPPSIQRSERGSRSGKSERKSERGWWWCERMWDLFRGVIIITGLEGPKDQKRRREDGRRGNNECKDAEGSYTREKNRKRGIIISSHRSECNSGLNCRATSCTMYTLDYTGMGKRKHEKPFVSDEKIKSPSSSICSPLPTLGPSSQTKD